ncbi:hypothetical protein [Actinoplanes sp. HUAS TT8]|uniref:hypothetical protein n=1 Tax=Actinoplanes sp. HUAS TT8 TaxID=3447453 RepID=UPI003F52842C
MQTASLTVDVDALRGIGVKAGAVATALRNATTAAESRLAVPIQFGSTAAKATQVAAKAWLDDLRRLAGDVATFGTGLTNAARDYQSEDQASAEQLSQVPR